MAWLPKKVALLAIALLSFLAMAAGVRALLPWPEGGGLRAKVLTWTDHRDSFDAIYLGSSLIAHGIDPVVVDSLVGRRLRREFTSFNLGVPAAHGFEVDRLIRSLLRDPPERLRFVVIEAPDLSADLEAFERLITDRTISWHTGHYTWLALRDLADSRRPPGSRRADAVLHLRMFARNLTNAGAGPGLVRARSGLGLEESTLLGTKGYSEMREPSDGSVAPSRQRLLDHPDRYRRRRNRFEARPRDTTSRPVELAALEAQVEFLTSRDLVPIYVFPPVLAPPDRWEELARQGTIPDFLSYASPARYPGLYRLASRWDEQHLTRTGALLWSQTLGGDLGEIIARRSAPR